LGVNFFLSAAHPSFIPSGYCEDAKNAGKAAVEREQESKTPQNLKRDAQDTEKDSLKRAIKDNERLRKSKSRLESDIKQLEAINSALTNKVKELYLRNEKLKDADRDRAAMRNVFDAAKKKNAALKKENEERKKLLAARGTEQANPWEDLGDAYVNLKLFDLAIDAYEKSLSIPSDNIEPHYKVGLLYANYKQNNVKAIRHMTKYMKLSHEPGDVRKAKYMLRMLREGVMWDKTD